MKKIVISIDRDKCIGCGSCADTCHQGAIAMFDGKAMLVGENHCDGLGRCLPHCPADAIQLIEKDVEENTMEQRTTTTPPAGGCPGSMSRSIERSEPAIGTSPVIPAVPAGSTASELRNWPVQLQLAPINAPYFDGADLLIAADCTAFSYGAFQNKLLRGKVCLIGCPKLDTADYAEKICHILKSNDIRSLTIARMEVPCCGGIAQAAVDALASCGKMIPWNIVTIGIDGDRLPSSQVPLVQRQIEI